MLRLTLTIIALALALTVIKAAIAALVVAGLIFRTQQTAGLLALGGLLTVIGAYPLVGIGLVTTFAAAALLKACTTRSAPLLIDDPAQE